MTAFRAACLDLLMQPCQPYLHTFTATPKQIATVFNKLGLWVTRLMYTIQTTSNFNHPSKQDPSTGRLQRCLTAGLLRINKSLANTLTGSGCVREMALTWGPWLWMWTAVPDVVLFVVVVVVVRVGAELPW